MAVELEKQEVCGEPPWYYVTTAVPIKNVLLQCNAGK